MGRNGQASKKRTSSFVEVVAGSGGHRADLYTLKVGGCLLCCLSAQPCVAAIFTSVDTQDPAALTLLLRRISTKFELSDPASPEDAVSGWCGRAAVDRRGR